jgi:hypothetical protein
MSARTTRVVTMRARAPAGATARRANARCARTNGARDRATTRRRRRHRPMGNRPHGLAVEADIFLTIERRGRRERDRATAEATAGRRDGVGRGSALEGRDATAWTAGDRRSGGGRRRGGLGFERDERETDETVDFERSNSFGEQADDSRRRRRRR